MTSFDGNCTDSVTVSDLESVMNLSAQCVVTEGVIAEALLEAVKQTFDTLTESLTGTSPATAGLEYQALASTGGIMSDTASVTKLVLLVCEETVTVTPTVIPNASLQALCTEGVVVAALLVVSGELYVVWVANDETMAHTQYTNFNFNSMCRLGNRYYGANDAGIYLLEGDDDAGDDIQFFFTLPTTDFDDSGLKRLPEALMGNTIGGDVLIKVLVEGKAPAIYRFNRSSGSNQQARAKVGQGIKSRFFTFDIYNTEGEHSEIDQVEFFPISMRRVK